jgi:glutamate-ammonia-ligase adenylyltransferase
MKKTPPLTDFEQLIAPDRYLWDQLQTLLRARDLTLDERQRQHLQRLVVGSGYALQQLTRHPEWVDELLRQPAFSLDPDALRASLQGLADLNGLKRVLRQARHRHLLEIICLDVCMQQPVETSLQQLSDLADALIAAALERIESILAERHGQPVDTEGRPVTLNVIGMGKLGGHELNFSSDIDLICIYREEGELRGFGKLSHQQFFTRVTQQLVQCLNDQTEDGFVYRVDLRLRPWGDAGPVAMSHAAFEHYYQLHGRDWEQYAMVKARVITGSEIDRRAIDQIIRPFVYRRYHDYRVFDGLARLKNSIDREARGQKARDNIKIGKGGIREIEFFVQAFQILKGGRNHRLQTRRLLEALAVLEDEEIIEAETTGELAAAYRFLRLVENRLQMLQDQQTHILPADESAQRRIAALLEAGDWSELKRQIDRHRECVSRHFDQLFRAEEPESPESSPALDEMEQPALTDYLASIGFPEPQAAAERLQAFFTSRPLLYLSKQAKQRLQAILPLLLQQAAQQPDTDSLLQRLLDLLGAIAGRSVYYELLYQNRPMLDRLVKIFAASAWVAEQVSRYPMLLETLLYPGDDGERFDRQQLAESLQRQLDNVAGDVEMELDVLRQFKRAQTLVIASAELGGEIDAMQAAGHLSELAELLLQAVYRLASSELLSVHGRPLHRVDGELREARLGIIGYGKLGGRELHYQSDLDIIFLHDSGGDQAMTDGPRPIDNNQFFARLAQKIISRITLLTAAGKLYEIDTRLRPDGASGMLVSSLAAFRDYQLNKAWTWEHQALIRARFVAGDASITEPFAAIREEVLRQQRDEDRLRREIIDMRERMYQAKKPPEGERIDLKHSRGGLVDIEFLVQYRVLAGANKFASLCQRTDNIGLLSALHEVGMIDDDCVHLREIYRIFHQWLHARVLQNRNAEVEARSLGPQLETVRACWQRWLEP